jgi:hypothetical protein
MQMWGYPPGDWKDLLTAIAILVGGIWTFYQFALRKAFESALLIDVEPKTLAPGVSSVRVRLENKGNRRITAPPELSPEQIRDYEDSVEFPADLQLRRVGAGKLDSFIGWWGRTSDGSTATSPAHVSLLYEYTRSDGKVDFFMEPGEVYYFECAYRLTPGLYAVKVVFVGKRATAAEFWSRISFFHVPG